MNTGFRFHDLKGKTLFLSGITRGIGKALLRGLLEQGLRLVAVSRGGKEMEAVRRDLGVGEGRLRLFECDLSDPVAVAETAEKIRNSGLVLDALLHNAAIDPRQSLEKTDEALWMQVLQVNLVSAATFTRILRPAIRDGGSIVFTGSVVYELGVAYLSAYAASKGAIVGLTRSLAHELKGTGIRVNCVVPGAIAVEKENLTVAETRRLIGWQSIPRRLMPDDLLGLICLLVSDVGSAITGQTITVDGGLMHPLADASAQEILLSEAE